MFESVGLTDPVVARNLIGFAASTEARMRSYFVAEVVRCAFSYGCYQMEIFQGTSFPSIVSLHYNAVGW